MAGTTSALILDRKNVDEARADPWTPDSLQGLASLYSKAESEDWAKLDQAIDELINIYDEKCVLLQALLLRCF